jgi:hypothetical protein
LQFVSNGSAIDSSFEINDIQIVYREKVRKWVILKIKEIFSI